MWQRLQGLRPRCIVAAVGEILLDHVTKEFGNGVLAVNDVNLTIEEGEFMVLVGPSGCGKTTLLRSIGGLEKITAGRIFIGSRDVTRSEPAARDLAMVFQNYALYPHMTVRKNLGYGLRVRKVPRSQREERVHEVAKLLGLEELLDRRPGQLSGGQQQRVAMGRAIVREPQAFLMDEPLSNLDAKLRVGMRTSLAQLHARLGVTTIYVTHDQTEAMTLGQRVAVMRDGHVLQVDTPQTLYSRPADLFVAGFIGTPAMNLVEARLDAGEVVFGSHRVPLDSARRPAARDGNIVLGIRPEAFEQADLARPGLPTLDATVTVVEELGADAHIFFPVDAAPARDAKAAAGQVEPLEGEGTLFTARVAPSTTTRVGDRLRLAVDPARFHFFDPETGRSLVGGPVEKPQPAFAPAAG